MTIGNLNKKFGWLWLLIAPLMGMVISSQFNTKGVEYASIMNEVTIAGQSLTLYMGESFPRVLNRYIHVHGGLLAFLNILYGLSIDDVPLSDNTKKLGSILAVIGAIFVTLSFFVLMTTSLSSISLPLRALGGLGLVVSILILVVGELKK